MFYQLSALIADAFLLRQDKIGMGKRIGYGLG